MPGDIHWGWLSAGLHLAGANGSTSFPDVRGHTFTRSGSVAISTAQSRFAGEGSAYFPGGNSDRLVCAASPDFNMRGGSLSICWSMYPLALPAAGTQCRVIMIGANSYSWGFVIAINEVGQLGGYIPVGGMNSLFSAVGQVALNAWQDFEFSVFNRNAILFKNGSLIAAMSGLDMPADAYDAATYPNPIKIGGDQSGFSSVDANFAGYLSEFRFMAHAGRHAGDFTPESGPFPESLDLHVLPAAPPSLLVASSPEPGRVVARVDSSPLWDTEHGGRGRVIGTTRNTGSPDYPVSRRVRLARKRDGVLARETWSDAAGNYLFEHVRHDIEYVVTAHDHTGLYNAVIADSVTPELMP
jgi:hypothetical protein